MSTSMLGTMLGPLSLVHVVGVAYVVAGAAIATLVARRGHPTAVVLGALVCWPLFGSLLFTDPQPTGGGPMHARILAAMAALRDAMTEPGADILAPSSDVDALTRDLLLADARLVEADRLLAAVVAGGQATSTGVAEGAAALRRARAAAASQIEAVLDGAVQLRLQIGLRSLAGNAVPVAERLRDLRGRLAAIEELAAVELHP
jgi:hypothetical protein